MGALIRLLLFYLRYMKGAMLMLDRARISEDHLGSPLVTRLGIYDLLDVTIFFSPPTSCPLCLVSLFMHLTLFLCTLLLF